MSARAITFLGFAVIFGAVLGWSVVAARRPTLATLPQVVAGLTRSRIVRFVLIAGWAWVGWHLFARGSGAFE